MLYIPQALRFNVGDRVVSVAKDHTEHETFIVTEVTSWPLCDYLATSVLDPRPYAIEWGFRDGELEFAS